MKFHSENEAEVHRLYRVEGWSQRAISRYFNCHHTSIWRVLHKNKIELSDKTIADMSLSQEHADLLFQLIRRHTEEKSTIITTNSVFQDWPTMFPNTCNVTPLVDRLIERCEVIQIIGNSHKQKRHKEQT